MGTRLLCCVSDGTTGQNGDHAGGREPGSLLHSLAPVWGHHPRPGGEDTSHGAQRPPSCVQGTVVTWGGVSAGKSVGAGPAGFPVPTLGRGGQQVCSGVHWDGGGDRWAGQAGFPGDVFVGAAWLLSQEVKQTLCPSPGAWEVCSQAVTAPGWGLISREAARHRSLCLLKRCSQT